METSTKQLEEQIVKVLDANHVCSFGTVDGKKPKVRYMALFHDGLTLYLATNNKMDKVDEITPSTIEYMAKNAKPQVWKK
ncbi:hypothetical protein FU659_04430 [Paenibacillus sp. N3.4]|nr:hypothetical protein FU659_04430 [Paenibacillus sp. N3.4]